MFDKMAIWIRIYDLPFGFMNNKLGWELAKKVGSVVKVETDARGRAWGPYQRAKVEVDISKPLLRCVTVFSERKKITELYNVRYEKLPNYCYSCGIIGHSSIECLMPAERDENGILPYGKDLRVIDNNRQKKNPEERQARSVGRSFNSDNHRVSSNDKQNGSDSRGHSGGSLTATVQDRDKFAKENEALSPLNQQGQKGKMKILEIGEDNVRKELFPTPSRNQGTKHKQVSPSETCTTSCDKDLRMDATDAMAIIVSGALEQFNPTWQCLEMETGLHGEEDEMAKKMRTTNNQLEDRSAEVARRPR